MKKIVFLFDVDGTLVDAGGAGSRSMVMAFEELYGVENAFEHETFTGRTDPLIFRDCYLKHLYIPPSLEEFKKFFKVYLAILKEEVQKSIGYRVLPCVREFLDFLKSDDLFIFGLCTGNLEQGAKLKLSRAGLFEYFAFGGYGSDSIERVEISKIAIEKAKNLAGVPLLNKDIYIVGDSPHEIQCARELNVRSISLCTGWTPKEELTKELPSFLFNDLTNFKNWIPDIING